MKSNKKTLPKKRLRSKVKDDNSEKEFEDSYNSKSNEIEDYYEEDSSVSQSITGKQNGKNGKK